MEHLIEEPHGILSLVHLMLAYPQLAAISLKKPLAIFGFGVLEDPPQGNKTAWIHDALKSIASDRYSRIKAISYWNEEWNDCTIVCVPGLNGMINLKLDSSQNCRGI